MVHCLKQRKYFRWRELMGSQRIWTLLLLYFNLIMSGVSVLQFTLNRKMAMFFPFCWFLLTNSVFYGLKFISSCLFRWQIESKTSPQGFDLFKGQKKEDEVSPPSKEPPACFDSILPEEIEVKASEYDGFEERENQPTFSFKFRFQSSEDTKRSIETSQGTADRQERAPQVSGFMSVQNQAFFDSKSISSIKAQLDDINKLRTEVVQVEPTHNFEHSAGALGHESEKTTMEVSNKEFVAENHELQLDQDYLVVESDAESITYSDESVEFINVRPFAVNQLNPFLTESDLRGDSESDYELIEDSEPTSFSVSSISDIVEFSQSSSISTRTSTSDDSSTQAIKFQSHEKNVNEFDDHRKDEKEESMVMKERLNSESEDLSSDLESLWEQQDLIEQLKMELRKVRAIGLPTILEECEESPKDIKDLKPWKIEENFLQEEDPIDELHKFYRSYRERMRKFDILNYQKMYAIGILQLEDPLQLMAAYRTKSTATIGSLWRSSNNVDQHQKLGTEPSKKFLKELHGDLETIYVGQMCLTWEFLHWEYDKFRELSHIAADHAHGCPNYNQVAEEFQQFQVLLQRFLENEPFQGPRLLTYIKSRCVHRRNFLHVPPIKEDNPMVKEGEKRRGNINGITSQMLTEMMEECIRIFWDFIKADKSNIETNVTIFKGFCGTQMELQDPTDSQLFASIRAELLKKEKKLRDLLKTGNCLIKKFQKHQQERSNELVFLAQVDVKLVSRVLKMTRITTEQLHWCQKKLSKINFHDRKIHREQSFLLFPC